MARVDTLHALSLARARRAYRAPPCLQSLEELLDWLPGHTADVHLEGRLDRPMEWCPSRLNPPDHPERWTVAAMVELNLRTLPAPAVYQEDDAVTLRWDSDAAPEFWLEVRVGPLAPRVRGRGVPHDAVVTYRGERAIRWDAASAPAFWLQVNFCAPISVPQINE